MGSRRDHPELLAGEAARLNFAVGLYRQRRRSSFENHTALVQMFMLFQSTSPSGSLGGLSSFIERPQILRAFCLAAAWKTRQAPRPTKSLFEFARPSFQVCSDLRRSAYHCGAAVEDDASN